MKRLLSALGAIILAATTAGCGLGTAGGYSPKGTLAGPLAGISLQGAEVAVGSKNFSEQLILGKLAVELLQSAGAEVSDLTNIPGSSSSRQAMLRGDISFMWDYTGTAWISYLGHDDPIPDEAAQYRAVRDEDAPNGLVWLPPAPANNTYAMATPRATAEKYGITKMSQIAAAVPPEKQSFCVDSEFANRNDGLQPMLATYKIPNPGPDQVSTLDTGSIYAATAGGTCTFGEVFTTDGRILALDLVVMEDDSAFFPKYNLSGIVRQDVLDAHPEITDLFAPISKKLDNETMQKLNARVDVEGAEPTDVAWQWLKDEGFVTG